ncbi:MAG: glycosyltransferase [Bdellovibrionales bacterium]|nr:glycosyltransferase [Bdellovibrionales bacterium]
MSFSGRLVILRLASLEAIPVALWQTQIFQENDLRPLVVEYGTQTPSAGHYDRIHWDTRWARWVPRPFRAMSVWLWVWLKLHIAFVLYGPPRELVTHGLQESLLAYALSFFWNVPYVCDVHEVYEPREMRGTNRIFFWFEGAALRKARLLIFPERNRMRLYQRRYGLSQPTFTVFNCPRREKTAGGTHENLRQELGIEATDRVLLYLGGIGSGSCLEAAVASLRYDERLHLLLVGWADPDVVARLRQLCDVFGVKSRVHFCGPSRDRWKYFAIADASYCVYRDHILRLRLAATASNKLMESLAAGVPVITLCGGGFEALVQSNQVGVCLESAKPKKIAEAVGILAAAGKLPRERARGLHQAAFNYDQQFQPVLRQFLQEKPASGL